MFAINHAATALVFKKKFPAVKLLWLTIAVQFIEFIWVALNLSGIEKTSTEANVIYIGDIHLHFMPFSHSLISTLILSGACYLLVKLFTGNSKTAVALSLALLSHIILDLLVHARDIPLDFLQSGSKYGSGLYPKLPYIAFIFEFIYGISCWFYYRGSLKLFAVIVGFNLANFTIFSPDVIGMEALFAGKPILLTSVILFQILITIWLIIRYSTVGNLSRIKESKYASTLETIS